MIAKSFLISNSYKMQKIANLTMVRAYLRVIAAGKMKPMQTAAVAPVNWKASQMLGMKLAPKNTNRRRTTVIRENLLLSEYNGPDEGKRRPSKLRRRAKKIIGNTSIRCIA